MAAERAEQIASPNFFGVQSELPLQIQERRGWRSTGDSRCFGARSMGNNFPNGSFAFPRHLMPEGSSARSFRRGRDRPHDACDWKDRLRVRPVSAFLEGDLAPQSGERARLTSSERSREPQSLLRRFEIWPQAQRRFIVRYRRIVFA